MNWFDLLLVAVIVGTIVGGFARGFARSAVSFVAFIAGVGAALWFYAPLGFWMRSFIASKPVANAVAFGLVLAVVTSCGAVLESIAGRFVRRNELRAVDRVLGGAFGVFHGLFSAAVLVLAFMAFAPHPLPEGARASRYLPLLTDVAHVVSQVAPEEIQEGYQRARRDLDELVPGGVAKGIDQATSF